MKSSEQDLLEVVDDRLNGVPQPLPVRAPLEGGHHHAKAILVDLEQVSGVGETNHKLVDQVMNEVIMLFVEQELKLIPDVTQG